MERRLLSNSMNFLKILMTLFCIMFLSFIFFEDAKRGTGFHNFIIFLPAITVVAGLLFTFLFRGKVHPVYYDDNNIYWVKNGVEQIISYSSIESFNVMMGGGTAQSEGNLNYYDKNNQVQSIRFIINNSKYTSESVLREVQGLIQIQKLGFKIVLESFFSSRELE